MPPHPSSQKKIPNGTFFCDAERQGFEPWVPFYRYNCLAGSCLQPLGHLSKQVKYFTLVASWFPPPENKYVFRCRASVIAQPDLISLDSTSAGRPPLPMCLLALRHLPKAGAAKVLQTIVLIIIQWMIMSNKNNNSKSNECLKMLQTARALYSSLNHVLALYKTIFLSTKLFMASTVSSITCGGLLATHTAKL